MFPHRRSTPGLRPLLLFLAAAATACGDRTHLTNPLSSGDANRTAAASPNTAKVKVKALQLSSNTLALEAPPISGNVDLGNSGVPIDGVSIRGEIVQGSVTKDAMLKQLDCAGKPGTLPAGTCSMTFSAVASNSATGTAGTLVPGSATFVLDVIQTIGSSVTVLATKSLIITLAAPVAITNVTLNSTTIQIDGPSVGWTTTVNNPTGALHGVSIKGTIVQGNTQQIVGGGPTSCGSPGVLPTGLCTSAFTLTASSSTGGSALVPGPATFKVQLLDSDGTTTTILDTKVVAITLVPNHPWIKSIVVFPTELAIDGPTALVTVMLNNPTDAPAPGLNLVESVIQGATQRGAGGVQVSCGASDGVLPPGDCKVTLTASASNSANGTGTLMIGAAEVQVDLKVSTRTDDYLVDSKRSPITLLPAPTPIITNVLLNPANFLLDAPASNYSVSLKNQNVNSFTNLSVRVSLIQGGVPRVVTETPLDCGAGPGVFPQGGCTALGSLAATSDQSVTAGSASLQVELLQTSGGATTTYDTKTIAVTVDPPR